MTKVEETAPFNKAAVVSIGSMVAAVGALLLGRQSLPPSIAHVVSVVYLGGPIVAIIAGVVGIGQIRTADDQGVWQRGGLLAGLGILSALILMVVGAFAEVLTIRSVPPWAAWLLGQPPITRSWGDSDLRLFPLKRGG